MFPQIFACKKVDVVSNDAADLSTVVRHLDVIC